MNDANELKLQVSSLSPGTKLNLDILRDGETKEFSAISGERPERALLDSPPNRFPGVTKARSKASRSTTSIRKRAGS